MSMVRIEGSSCANDGVLAEVRRGWEGEDGDGEYKPFR